MKSSYNSYICANSANGFYTMQSEVLNTDKVFIIKGGPGTGKSTFMKKTADILNKEGYETERILCSSDPFSLDGVVAKGFFMFDGTPPHTAEPPYPGAVGKIIDLGSCWDSEKLSNRKNDIINIDRQMKDRYQNAYNLLHCAGNVFGIIDSITEKAIITEKICKFAKTFAKKITGNRKNKRKGVSQIRFCRAINYRGVTEDKTSETALCKTVYRVKDKYLSVGCAFLKHLKTELLEMGCDIIEYRNPLLPEKVEKIIIPEYKTAVSCLGKESKPYKCINSDRFTDKNQMIRNREKLTFYRKLGRELINDAVKRFGEAKKLHDKLEEIYIPCMDFKKADRLCEQTVQCIIRSMNNESKEEKTS